MSSFKHILGWVCLLELLRAQAGTAHEFLRPHDAAELGRFSPVIEDTAVAVPGTRVAYADYAAIRRDFPQMAGLRDSEINAWLIQNAAFISSGQKQLDGIRNSPIPTDPARTTRLFRPSGWNRSAVLEVRDPTGGEVIGMIDVKGVGHGKPTHHKVQDQLDRFRKIRGDPQALAALRTSDHSDGLMSFGEAIAETTRQTAAQRLFEEKTAVRETVETYAILSLPVEILKEGDRSIPAALYLRQAHFGRKFGLEVPPTIYEDFHGGRQKTSSDTAVDFGGVLIRDERLQSHFGPLPEMNARDAQASKPWGWGHEVAEAFYRRNDLDAVNRHLSEMLAALGPRQLRPEHAAFRQRALLYLGEDGSRTVAQRLDRISRAAHEAGPGCSAKFGIAAGP